MGDEGGLMSVVDRLSAVWGERGGFLWVGRVSWVRYWKGFLGVGWDFPDVRWKRVCVGVAGYMRRRFPSFTDRQKQKE